MRRIHDLSQGGLAAHKLGFLLQIADGRVLSEADGPLVAGLLAHEYLQKSRLAGAVRANEGPALAGVELKGGPGIQNPSAERLGNFIC